MAYLDEHPPASPQFRARREEPSGVVVVHTAENTPDLVAFDGGAEAVAGFIQRRTDPGSYHDLGDSDSCLQLVRYECEAFHDGTGSNRHSYGVSVATRADVWPLAPQAWRDGAVRQAATGAARYARWLHARRKIVIPPRRITRAESEMRIPGFISHAERDPARRSDPGKDFPWADFLAHYHRLTADLQGTAPPEPAPAPDLEVPDMYVLDCAGKPALVVGLGGVQQLNAGQRSALKDVLGVEVKRNDDVAKWDALWSLRTKPLDVEALTSALAAKFPAGSVDVAALMSEFRQLLATVEVESTGHLVLADG